MKRKGKDWTAEIGKGLWYYPFRAPVAQLDRALVSQTVGRGFESHRGVYSIDNVYKAGASYRCETIAYPRAFGHEFTTYC
jgi:hypothetical protein